MKKLISYVLLFIDKAGPFYFILSSVFSLSGELDETVTYLLLISCLFGVVLVLVETRENK